MCTRHPAQRDATVGDALISGFIPCSNRQLSLFTVECYTGVTDAELLAARGSQAETMVAIVKTGKAIPHQEYCLDTSSVFKRKIAPPHPYRLIFAGRQLVN
mmetsp:Transcript_20331/g.56361  ORF Transcript_20331/g.56361 Transcript_20331/m.56361 type:complete len:101 (+) Transcript_20331:569-871(+)